MRIAHLTATYPPYPGGAGNTAYEFAIAQAARGHDVQVITAPHPGEIPPTPGVKVHRIKPVFAIGNAPFIPRIARLSGFDVIHLYYPFIFGAELVMLARSRPAGRDQALLVHYENRLVGPGPRGLLFNGYEHTVAPALIRSADKVAALSEDHGHSIGYLRDLAENSPQRFTTIPNPVDTNRFSPGDSDLREQLGIPADAVVGIYVGTLDLAHKFKRVDITIDAIAGLPEDERENFHLVVAGGGELLEGFREYADTAGIGERTHFLGSVSQAELPGVLRGGDIFLFSTEPPESFGIAMAEAMACGLPAVATRYPGAEAVNSHGETGYVVDLGDVDGFREAVRELIAAGPEKRRQMGDAARQRVVDNWGPETILDQLEVAYAEAIATRKERLAGK